MRTNFSLWKLWKVFLKFMEIKKFDVFIHEKGSALDTIILFVHFPPECHPRQFVFIHDNFYLYILAEPANVTWSRFHALAVKLEAEILIPLSKLLFL